MKSKLIIVLSVAALLSFGERSLAQEKENAATKELMAVVEKIKGKLTVARTADNGNPKKLTEADFAAEIKVLDDLYAKSKTTAPQDAVSALQLKASVYADLLGDRAMSVKLMEQIKTEFPDIIKKQQEQAAAQQAAIEKAQAALAVGLKFPDFDEKDLNGKPLSIANYKGKVVLIDFWATWCGPCVKELPSVQAAYAKHHGKGFEIIGISLDSDKGKLESFISANSMPWQQFFDGKGWSNKLSTKYGINSIPATYLIDGEGKIIGKELRGEALEEAVAKALTKG